MDFTNQSSSLHRVFLLIDIEVGLMDSDKMLIEMLTETKKPFMMVMTKADKVKDAAIKEQMVKAADFVKTSGALSSPFIHAVSS